MEDDGVCSQRGKLLIWRQTENLLAGDRTGVEQDADKAEDAKTNPSFLF